MICVLQVSKTAEPPVVKIFDYNKQKYIAQTKEKERSKSKVRYFLTIEYF